MSTNPEKLGIEARVYPSPTLVVGVGELGLCVLERLGEDWEVLRRAGGDATLENLRLLYLAAGGRGQSSWRALEGQTTRLARQAGEGDLPSLAVNLMILRSLGLVRFRDGTYQVALPRDGGVVGAAEPFGGALDSGGRAAGGEVPLRRRRYFDWLSLSPDPVTAVERLYRHAERTSELDLFITPIIHRVRQGHSPRALLACIGRCHALAGGRDPSPWGWVKGLAESSGQKAEQPLRLRFPVRDPRAQQWLGLRPWDLHSVSHQPGSGLLDGYAPPPLLGWREWLAAYHLKSARSSGESSEGPSNARLGGASLGDGESGEQSLELCIPAPFVPRAEDVELWLDPLELLKVDWETTGWATGEVEGAEPVEFEPVEASPFRLGLFDHDATGRLEGELGQPLAGRLGTLADLTRRGLVRLWIDLQRDRVEENGIQHWVEDRRRESADEALRQSLEVLGELLVRPLAAAEPEAPAGFTGAEPVEEERQASRPSPLLSGCELGQRGGGTAVSRLLNQRLAGLGLADVAGVEENRRLLQTVELHSSGVATGDATQGPASCDATSGFPALASALNQQVRDLLHIEFLGQYRNQPIRRPPRLTLYLVGDMGEPFVRATLRQALREIHAELLRSFSPIFEHYREGFDRSLAIVPILWMPHPADPFAGHSTTPRREEESAIIDAIQGVRRWVESVIPASRRRVSQIFINSMLTETAVLSRRDAVRQTRDFITFQMRNDLGADEWLRRTAVGPAGDDFFSSFACYEIAFPAEKARQYLANRLGRELLSTLREGRGEEAVRVDSKTLAPPPVVELLRGAGSRLSRQTSQAATALAERVGGRIRVAPEVTSREISARFDHGFGQELVREVQRNWLHLVERRGEMDALVDGLRRTVSRLLSDTLRGVREQGDRWIEDLAGRLGLTTVSSAFTELRLAARGNLERCEERRRRQEAHCVVHRVPETSALERARLVVVEAADGKADLGPMRWGFLLWLMLAPALGAPIYQGLTGLLNAQGTSANWLSSYGPWMGFLVVAVVGGWFLKGVVERDLARITEAIDALARSCRRVVEGDQSQEGSGSHPSVHSFFEARLRLTGALAARGFALQVCDQATSDCRRAERMRRSVETQIHLLERRAEGLGVRPSLDAEGGERVDRLFASRSGEDVETLVDPASLSGFFERRWGAGGEHGALVPPLLQATGGFAHWRERAPLADSEQILAFCRLQCGVLVDLRLCQQHPLAEEATRRLREFVARHFSNIGFGARFIGSEGLDPDGVHVLAEAALVLSGDLRDLFARGTTCEGPLTTRTMDIVTCGVRPNTAYMLSLAQGIRPHTVRNLRRFESFHDRTTLSEDRTFPLSGDDGEQGSLNHFSTYGSLARALHQRFAKEGRSKSSGETGEGRA